MRLWYDALAGAIAGSVDRLGRLVIPLPEQVHIDFQRNNRRGVPEPLADYHHVDPGVYELRGVGVPQRMERDCTPSGEKQSSSLTVEVQIWVRLFWLG
jgi:hypothetical protein